MKTEAAQDELNTPFIVIKAHDWRHRRQSVSFATNELQKTQQIFTK